MLHVAKKMPKFNYDPAIGSFKAWLLNKVRWASIEQLRKRGRFEVEPSAAKDTGTRLMDKVADPGSLVPDRIWEEQWQKNLLEVAISKIQPRVNPRNYQIYDFYVNKGWPAEKVAAAFGVTVNLVHTAKHRVIETIAQEVKRLEKILD